jgi:hypothetical protein
MKTMNWFLSLAVCGALACWCVQTPAQELGGTAGVKENLDLPLDALGDSGEEEDAPETIHFYGQIYEGDGFFFTIDRSTSMQDSGELQIAKREMIRNIQELSNRTQFAVNFFDAGLIYFPQSGRPAEATQAMKGAGIAFINGTPGGAGSCCQKGLLNALRFANLSTSKRKVIVYVGDGGGHCGGDESTYHRQTLANVVQQNYQRAQVNTIGVLMQGNAAHREQFLRQLATMNNGTYKRIN